MFKNLRLVGGLLLVTLVAHRPAMHPAAKHRITSYHFISEEEVRKPGEWISRHAGHRGAGGRTADGARASRVNVRHDSAGSGPEPRRHGPDLLLAGYGLRARGELHLPPGHR